ncbi:hypothetical protein D3C87_111880 [compost metagenome]
MSSDSSFSKREVTGLVLLAVLTMAVTTIAVVPSLRSQVKDFFTMENRTILAKVSGNLGPLGPKVTALKFRSSEGLALEIYSDSDADGLVLIAKINLGEKRDGYVSVQGNATNLALVDVDYDGLMEIVAPTYDDQMVPRLNIFKYNPNTRHFDRVNAPENTKF